MTDPSAALVTWALVGVIAIASALWFLMRRRVDVSCTLDLEATQDHFHAHVDLHGVAVDAGDEVLVHGAPSRIALGARRSLTARATVHRASWLRRQLVKLTGGTAIGELYEVGFEG